MGAQLVALVLSEWTQLNDTDYRIVLRMALTALDHETNGHPAHLYFGGHELLARSLRRPFPEGDDEQARKARQNILRDVRRSVKRITDLGAIEVVETGRVIRQGEAKTYRLTLWRRAGVNNPSSAGVVTPSSVHDTAGADDPSSGGAISPLSAGVVSPHEQGLTTPARNHGGAIEEPREEKRADAGDQPQDARDAREQTGQHEPESLRLVETDGVRDPLPAAPGVPGQRAMLLPVAAPHDPAAASQAPDAGSGAPDAADVPYGRCDGCGRAFLRSRAICPHCNLMAGDAS